METRLERPGYRALLCLCLTAAPALFWPGVGEWFLRLGHWWLCIFLRAFCVSCLLTPCSMLLAGRLGALDFPDKRRIHARPMPRLGGLAIVAAVLLATGRYALGSAPLLLLLIGSLAIYLLSLADDFQPLSAQFRLAFQLGICFLLIAGGIHLNTVPDNLPGSNILNALLTVVWIVGLINAVNFLDGIDGLAASLGLVCAALFLLVGWETRQSALALLTAALAGACLGFLPFNWHPAATFLGDGGATVIGFLLASVAVWGSWSEGNPVVSFSTPLLILSIPIFDMIYITFSRIKNDQVRSVREWLEYVGTDHLHHRLLKLGMTQRQAVLFVLALNLALGMSALAIRSPSGQAETGYLLAQSVLIFGIIATLMLVGRERTP